MLINVLDLAVTLFLVMDPIGNVPMFVVSLNGIDKKRKTKILIRECLFALIIFTIFLFSGEYILKFLGISNYSLGVAGGIILFLIAIKMIFPDEKDANDYEGKKQRPEPFLVPLAIPLFAGPAALTTLILFCQNDKNTDLSIFLAMILAWFVSSIILVCSGKISELLGSDFIKALERLMGLILTTIAVQMLLSGIKNYFAL